MMMMDRESPTVLGSITDNIPNKALSVLLRQELVGGRQPQELGGLGGECG